MTPLVHRSCCYRVCLFPLAKCRESANPHGPRQEFHILCCNAAELLQCIADFSCNATIRGSSPCVRSTSFSRHFSKWKLNATLPMQAWWLRESIETVSNVYRKSIESLSKGCRTSIEILYRNSISKVYRTYIGSLSEIYRISIDRKSIESLSNLYQTSLRYSIAASGKK